MDKLDDIVSAPTAVFAIMLTVVTFMFRGLVEAVFPTLSSKTPTSVAQRVWEGPVLESTPALLGAALTPLLSTSFPFPRVVTATTTSCIVYGLVIGWFSSSFYSGVSFFVRKKWNVDIPDLDKK